MNTLWSDPKIYRYSILGLIAIAVAWCLLLLARWYAGMVFLIPLSALNIYQFVQCVRWRRNNKE